MHDYWDYDEEYEDDYDEFGWWDDNLFSYDYEDDYYEDLAYDRGEMTTWQRITEKAKHFWNVYLGMKKCGDCGKLFRFGNHDDCMPF